MGKVYDALRRAEEQRAQRLQETAEAGIPPAMPLATDPAVESVPAQPKRRPRKVLGALRQSDAPAEPASAAELNKRRVALLQPDSFAAEQFRSLRARIDSLGAVRPVRTLAITSARAGDGKTMAAISLAAVSAMQPGARVLLIDCDLRMPSVAQSLGLRVDAGLMEVLQGTASLDQAISRPDASPLEVLPVRGLPSNPSELLGSPAMRQLLEQAASSYDRIILDLPPTLGLPDAKIVSELSDGVVFVVKADSTPQSDAEAAIEVLERDRVLGLVMNGVADEMSAYSRA